MVQIQIIQKLLIQVFVTIGLFEFQESLSFKITGKRCLFSPKPWLCQPSVDCDMFYDRVESALTDNLRLQSAGICKVFHLNIFPILSKVLRQSRIRDN